MSDPYKKSGLCLNCKVNREAILYRQMSVNGAIQFAWKCSVCEKQNPFGSNQIWIPRETVERHLTQEQIEFLPTLVPDSSVRCVRCGGRNAELHHWAPKAIFGLNEADRWPKDYLCKTCHAAWHKLVTPQLVKDTWKP